MIVTLDFQTKPLCVRFAACRILSIPSIKTPSRNVCLKISASLTLQINRSRYLSCLLTNVLEIITSVMRSTNLETKNTANKCLLTKYSKIED